MDVKRLDTGQYVVMSDFGTMPTGNCPAAWAQQAEGLGCGEILVTSVDRDGALEGYDVELCSQVSAAVRVPVMALGGCGSWPHMEKVFKEADVAAACTQNIYHFTDSSIRAAKKYLDKQGIRVRLS